MDDAVRPSTRPPRRRWGVWTLAFLTVALVVVLSSGDGYTPVTAFVLLVSLVTAAWTSWNGIRDTTWRGR